MFEGLSKKCRDRKKGKQRSTPRRGLDWPLTKPYRALRICHEGADAQVSLSDSAFPCHTQGAARTLGVCRAHHDHYHSLFFSFLPSLRSPVHSFPATQATVTQPSPEPLASFSLHQHWHPLLAMKDPCSWGSQTAPPNVVRSCPQAPTYSLLPSALRASMDQETQSFQP